MAVNCESTDLLGYVEGNLKGEEAAEVKGHLQDCGDCRTELVRIRAVLGAGASAAAELTCPSTEDLVSLASGEVDVSEEGALRAHIEGCAMCTKELKTARRSLERLEGITIRPEPVALPPELASIIEGGRGALMTELRRLLRALGAGDTRDMRASLTRVQGPLDWLREKLGTGTWEPTRAFARETEGPRSATDQMEILLPTLSGLRFESEDFTLRVEGKDDGTMDVHIRKAGGGPVRLELRLESAVGEVRRIEGDADGGVTLTGVPFGNNTLLIRARSDGEEKDDHGE